MRDCWVWHQSCGIYNEAAALSIWATEWVLNNQLPLCFSCGGFDTYIALLKWQKIHSSTKQYTALLKRRFFSLCSELFHDRQTVVTRVWNYLLHSLNLNTHCWKMPGLTCINLQHNGDGAFSHLNTVLSQKYGRIFVIRTIISYPVWIPSVV